MYLLRPSRTLKPMKTNRKPPKIPENTVKNLQNALKTLEKPRKPTKIPKISPEKNFPS